MKPIVGNFPNFPNFPNGVNTGSLPSLPSFGGFGGSSTQSPSKRQVNPNTIGEWIGQLGQGNNPFTGFTGNLPFKPPPGFGQFPFGGSSGSNENNQNES